MRFWALFLIFGLAAPLWAAESPVNLAGTWSGKGQRTPRGQLSLECPNFRIQVAQTETELRIEQIRQECTGLLLETGAISLGVDAASGKLRLGDREVGQITSDGFSARIDTLGAPGESLELAATVSGGELRWSQVEFATAGTSRSSGALRRP